LHYIILLYNTGQDYVLWQLCDGSQTSRWFYAGRQLLAPETQNSAESWCLGEPFPHSESPTQVTGYTTKLAVDTITYSIYYNLQYIL